MGVTVLGIQHNFYPRSPCGERHCWHFAGVQQNCISIHALLAESDLRVLDGSKSSLISIHALLAESDTMDGRAHNISGISIHALLAESDFLRTRAGPIFPRFLSTLSLRRATLMWYQCNTVVKISIHALLAESDLIDLVDSPVAKISIHALLAESDEMPAYGSGDYERFLSTLSLRRATNGQTRAAGRCAISIHALLAESDHVAVVPVEQ